MIDSWFKKWSDDCQYFITTINSVAISNFIILVCSFVNRYFKIKFCWWFCFVLICHSVTILLYRSFTLKFNCVASQRTCDDNLHARSGEANRWREVFPPKWRHSCAWYKRENISPCRCIPRLFVDLLSELNEVLSGADILCQWRLVQDLERERNFSRVFTDTDSTNYVHSCF